MTDIEITRLCAEAMGWKVRPSSRKERFIAQINPDRSIAIGEGTSTMGKYEPLHDDAQAMALLTRFRLSVAGSCQKSWLVTSDNYACKNADLNRAICECVAKMQEAK